MRILLSLVLLLNASYALAFQVPPVNYVLNPFELTWMNHEDPTTVYRSADYPQAVFVLEAYFKNCPYCNQNAPMINRLRAHYADNQNVQILDIGRDCRLADYGAWIMQHSPNHPVLKDCERVVLNSLGVSLYPTTVIANCNLQVLNTHAGAWTNATFNSVVAEIDRALASDCQPR